MSSAVDKTQSKAVERDLFLRSERPLIHVKTAPWFKGPTSVGRVWKRDIDAGRFIVTVALDPDQERFESFDDFLEKWITD